MSRRWRVVVLVGVMTAGGSHADASMVRSTPLPALTASAARVLRGDCLSARVEETRVAGARIATTAYTFHVSEYLKGNGSPILTFRQVGTPTGGRFDLGRAAGLPVYEIGRSYVLFLLPESRAGLTSPSGAGEGALPIGPGERVRLMRGRGGMPELVPYREFHQRVSKAAGR